MDVSLDTNIDTNAHSTINNNDEQLIIEKYAKNLDKLSLDFIKNLPDNDKTILNKILIEQQKALPKEIPFTIV